MKKQGCVGRKTKLKIFECCRVWSVWRRGSNARGSKTYLRARFQAMKGVERKSLQNGMIRRVRNGPAGRVKAVAAARSY